MKIGFLDDSFAFSGVTLRTQPLGGIQGATVMLAEALARHGHQVTVFNPVRDDIIHENVLYRPLIEAGRGKLDVAVVNSAPKLFRGIVAGVKILWLHGPARYLRKPRHLLPLLGHRPWLVFSGAYHRGTMLPWLPWAKIAVIPHGIGIPFTDALPAVTPPSPRAIFLSNPRRGLDWLVPLWAEQIKPRVAGAELHIFSGRATYGTRGDARIDAALTVLDRYPDCGIVRREPVDKNRLVEELRRARVMLYRGDLGESFCFAAAEAQAMGVPLVTAGVGALRERVVDGVTGFCATDPQLFADYAVALMTDHDLWRRQHEAALARRGDGTWDQLVPRWEALWSS